MKAFTWFRILFKRQLKKVSTYVILALIIVLAVGIKYAADNLAITIQVGVMSEDEGENATRVLKDMLSHKGLINFVEYKDENELIEDVESGKIMGGYVLNDKFSAIMQLNLRKQAVRTYATPNGYINKTVDELVFGFVMKEIAYEVMVQDTVESDHFKKMDYEDIRSELREYYDTYLMNDSTFRLGYIGNFDKDIDKIELGRYVYDYLTPIIKGICYILIFLSALSGAVYYYNDKSNGGIKLLKAGSRTLVKLADVFIPTFLSTAATIVALAFTGQLGSGAFESFRSILEAVVYMIAVVLYSMALSTVVRKKEIFVSVIPVLILIALIFCPVFMNVASMVKSLGYVKYIVPLGYFY